MGAETPAGGLPGRIAIPLPNNLAAVPGLTGQVQELLKAHGVPGEDAINIRIAVAEACNNAIQYALSTEPGEVTASIENGRVTVTVSDHTPGFDLPEESSLPDPTAEHGRGLFLIRQTMDRVEYQRGPAGNRLIMTRKVAAG